MIYHLTERNSHLNKTRAVRVKWSVLKPAFIGRGLSCNKRYVLFHIIRIHIVLCERENVASGSRANGDDIYWARCHLDLIGPEWIFHKLAVEITFVPIPSHSMHDARNEERSVRSVQNMLYHHVWIFVFFFSLIYFLFLHISHSFCIADSGSSTRTIILLRLCIFFGAWNANEMQFGCPRVRWKCVFAYQVSRELPDMRVAHRIASHTATHILQVFDSIFLLCFQSNRTTICSMP